MRPDVELSISIEPGRRRVMFEDGFVVDVVTAEHTRMRQGLVDRFGEEHGKVVGDVEIEPQTVTWSDRLVADGES